MPPLRRVVSAVDSLKCFIHTNVYGRYSFVFDFLRDLEIDRVYFLLFR